ncbi:ABC-2 family transporter protein [Acetitomaculum ruminis DSM 5522]|uniref:ABC-2 family transporter protein n=1 Tax=Acetitomaculum ruminis DSM 5522 TaxID=1120918 RepID=A0A1I1A053_9FIRM|nr:ABC-2 transporter permease [Acetitomaculum ruminis]SFB30726.1 ABC-2 family transporter protein [Acetitomaculum ruminis DSM 5522]
MRNILKKEMFLTASVVTYVFILFGLMFFLPGYPILCGAFFSALGIFKSFESAREANDIVFSALLPIAKKDVVKGKYYFVCTIEVSSLFLMMLAMILRMTLLSDSTVYRNNVMMNANLFALGAAFIIFGLFNWIFVMGFFKTAYKYGKPFVIFIIVAFLSIGVFEALHHIPGFEGLNAFGCDNIILQLSMLIVGLLIYILMTILSCKKACEYFERIDL